MRDETRGNIALSLGLMAVLFIWFIAHTNALRYGLLGVLLLFGLWHWETRRAILPTLEVPLAFFVVMSAWLLLQLFWAWSPLETLGELKSQWLKAWLILITGAAVALRLTPFGMFHRPEGGFTVLRRVSEVLTLILLLQLLDYLRLWLFFDVLPRDAVGLFGFKTEMSYLANLLFAMCLAESLSRRGGLRPVLPISGGQLLFSLLVAVTLLFLAGARNGLIGMGFLLVSMSILVAFLLPFTARQRLAYFPVLMLVLVISAAVFSWKTDPRWARLSETIPHAINARTHPSWIDAERYPYPILSDGQIVERSAYERVSFLVEGLRLSADYPLGIGFTRKAFSHVVEAHYGKPSVHAHSGTVEWLLGMGWLGFALWLGFLLWLMKTALRDFFQRHSGLGLLIFCVVSGFAGRMMIENITRDLMLELFMLLLGILLACLHRDRCCQRSFF